MVSIIVPVYKSRDTLARCVESLQNQTAADLEILLVDDGSPDGSGELCTRRTEACPPPGTQEFGKRREST